MKLININQLMEIVGVSSRQTIYNWVRTGKLPPPVKQFGSPRWLESQINNNQDQEEIVIYRLNGRKPPD